MTFFVSSTPGGNGGNLGGLTGADAKCQALALAAGGGDHTWHAYLSATVQNAVTNAKDRIGAGPWKNQKGIVIAANVAALHAADFNVKGADLVDETGAVVPLNRHDIFTGSKRDGTLFTPEQTCSAWTSNTAASNNNDNADRGVVGHTDSDTNANATDGWNSAHGVGCAPNQLLQANGEGRLFCFAID